MTGTGQVMGKGGKLHPLNPAFLTPQSILDSFSHVNIDIIHITMKFEDCGQDDL